MSMKLFMILKFIQILCVYIGMTTVLPFFVLRTTLLRQRLTEKILICFLVGNFPFAVGYGVICFMVIQSSIAFMGGFFPGPLPFSTHLK